LRGGRPFSASWPRHLRTLSRTEKQIIQQRLSAEGYDTGGIDGQIGPKSKAALRAWQRDRGHVADGYATHDILETLR
jgi:membrane-bound lytic murein transglycosylase B